MRMRKLVWFGLGAAVVAVSWDLGTYDPRPWLSRHETYRSEIGPVVGAAAAAGRLRVADARQLDHRTTEAIGERTAGAGCGYVNGPTVFRFQAAALEVLMPNCARFLEDGTNEVEGITPDVAIPMHLEDRRQQASALWAALSR